MTLSHMHNIKRTFFACCTVSRLLLCSFPEAFHVKIWAYISQPVAVSKGLMTNLKYSRKIKVFFCRKREISCRNQQKQPGYPRKSTAPKIYLVAGYPAIFGTEY